MAKQEEKGMIDPVQILQQEIDSPNDYNILYTMPMSNGDVFISTAVIDGLMKEVQKVQTEFGSKVGRGGTFTLSFTDEMERKTTAPLAWDISANDMKTALESLLLLGSVTVTREDHLNGFLYSVQFDTEVGDLDLMSVDYANLQGAGTVQANVQEHVKGESEHIMNTTPQEIYEACDYLLKNLKDMHDATRDFLCKARENARIETVKANANIQQERTPCTCES